MALGQGRREPPGPLLAGAPGRLAQRLGRLLPGVRGQARGPLAQGDSRVLAQAGLERKRDGEQDGVVGQEAERMTGGPNADRFVRTMALESDTPGS